MRYIRVFRFWKNLGLISRLMLAVGIAIVAGGGVQTALLVAEGATEHSARLLREQKEALTYLAMLVVDQALVGDYAAIAQLLKNQVKKGEVDRFSWTDKDGKTLVAQDEPDRLDAPAWFARVAAIEHVSQSIDVMAGGGGDGKPGAPINPGKGANPPGGRVGKRTPIAAPPPFPLCAFIWLSFPGHPRT